MYTDGPGLVEIYDLPCLDLGNSQCLDKFPYISLERGLLLKRRQMAACLIDHELGVWYLLRDEFAALNRGNPVMPPNENEGRDYDLVEPIPYVVLKKRRESE